MNKQKRPIINEFACRSWGSQNVIVINVLGEIQCALRFLQDC